MEAYPLRAGVNAERAVDARNIYVMDSLLRDVTKYGTAARAATLKRPDIAGKTGTTNDSHDAWFAGYGGGVVAVAWMGFDQPRPLGDRETGGGLALPIWMSYMGPHPQDSSAARDSHAAGRCRRRRRRLLRRVPARLRRGCRRH